MFLPVASAMASVHNGILLVACNAECPDQQQLLVARERFLAISVTAGTHVIILHTTRKFVTPRPHPSHTDRHTSKILMY